MENEADPEVETADSSVYDDLMAEIERLKSQQAQQESHRPTTTTPDTQPVVQRSALGAQAMTNSMGGSLALRTYPAMDAPKSEVRVPDRTLLRVLEYSENGIILDGQKSRFALVDIKGQRGWVLESYLNFN